MHPSFPKFSVVLINTGVKGVSSDGAYLLRLGKSLSVRLIERLISVESPDRIRASAPGFDMHEVLNASDLDGKVVGIVVRSILS